MLRPFHRTIARCRTRPGLACAASAMKGVGRLRLNAPRDRSPLIPTNMLLVLLLWSARTPPIPLPLLLPRQGAVHVDIHRHPTPTAGTTTSGLAALSKGVMPPDGARRAIRSVRPPPKRHEAVGNLLRLRVREAEVDEPPVPPVSTMVVRSTHCCELLCVRTADGWYHEGSLPLSRKWLRRTNCVRYDQELLRATAVSLIL